MTAARKEEKQHRTRLTESVYKLLVEGFRKYPANAGAAARVAGVDARTAKKAWEIGLAYEFAKRPIREIVEEEKKLAGAYLHQQVQAVRAGAAVGQDVESVELPPPPTNPVKKSVSDAATADAVASRAQEAAIVRLARGNATVIAGVTAQLARAAARIAPRMEKAIDRLLAEAEKPDGVVPVGDIMEVAKLMDILARIHRTTAFAADRIFTMERRLLLDAGSADSVADMTEEEALREIAAANEAAERTRAKLTVLQGGKAVQRGDARPDDT